MHRACKATNTEGDVTAAARRQRRLRAGPRPQSLGRRKRATAMQPRCSGPARRLLRAYKTHIVANRPQPIDHTRKYEPARNLARVESYPLTCVTVPNHARTAEDHVRAALQRRSEGGGPQGSVGGQGRPPPGGRLHPPCHHPLFPFSIFQSRFFSPPGR